MDDRSSNASSHSTEGSPGRSPQLKQLKHGAKSLRGRGRGRGRPVKSRGGGRGRGRRAKAGQSGQTTEDRREEIARLREERTANVESQIDRLSEEEVRQLLLSLANRDPTLILEIMSASQEEQKVPTWWTCTRCREMATPVQKVCCGYNPQNCTSQLPNFQLILLDPEVLRVAKNQRNDLLADEDDRDLNKEMRHTGYRKYILWTYGRLTTGDSRVLPSCCVWAIRDRYPDANGQYVGFKPSRL